jgi:hypothetical protein
MGIWSRLQAAFGIAPTRQVQPHVDPFPADAGDPDENLRFALSDLASDGGGQRTEVGVPYSGEGGLRRDVREPWAPDKGVHSKS